MEYFSVFSQASCVYCQQAIDLLIQHKARFMVIDVEYMPEMLEIMKTMMNYQTTPMIWKMSAMSVNPMAMNNQPANAEFIGGYEDLVKHFNPLIMID